MLVGCEPAGDGRSPVARTGDGGGGGGAANGAGGGGGAGAGGAAATTGCAAAMTGCADEILPSTPSRAFFISAML